MKHLPALDPDFHPTIMKQPQLLDNLDSVSIEDLKEISNQVDEQLQERANHIEEIASKSYKPNTILANTFDKAFQRIARTFTVNQEEEFRVHPYIKARTLSSEPVDIVPTRDVAQNLANQNRLNEKANLPKYEIVIQAEQKQKQRYIEQISQIKGG